MRFATIFFIAVALAPAISLAEPVVNAPLMPIVNYFSAGNGSGGPVVSAVLIGDFAFTADSTGVWGMNVNNAANTKPAFYDAQTGVTQMWAWCKSWANTSSCSLHVIAGSDLVLYKMNDIAVWRAASFRTFQATFDIISDSPLTPSYMYPVVLPSEDGTSAFFVLGTRNTTYVWYYDWYDPNFTPPPSTVYAFDVQDLRIVWLTTINSASTNFQMANCSDYVWIIAQNQSNPGANYYNRTTVLTLHRNNGRLRDDFSVHTTMANTVATISVASGQFMFLGTSSYLSYGYVNGTMIASHFTAFVPCHGMPYAPVLINSTWYAICGSLVEMWDSETGVRKDPFVSSDPISSFAFNSETQEFVLSGGNTVYVGDASGIHELIELPDPWFGGNQGPATCTGARFNPSSSELSSSAERHVVHLSYKGYSSGTVLAMNYRSGEVTSQASANVQPVGPALVNSRNNRLCVASSSGSILQCYAFVSSEQQVSNDTNLYVSNTGLYPFAFSFVLNETSGVVYYIPNTGGIFILEKNGEIRWVADNYNYWGFSTSRKPLIVGQYILMNGNSGELIVYNSQNHAWNASTSSIFLIGAFDPNIEPTLFGSIAIAYQAYPWDGLWIYVIDLKNPSNVVTIDVSSPRTASGTVVIGASTLLAITGESVIKGFNIFDLPGPTADYYPYYQQVNPNSQMFEVNSSQSNIASIISPLVAFNDQAYFVARSGNINVVFSVNATGFLRKIGVVAEFNSTAEYKTLLIKRSGVFTAPTIVVAGQRSVSAYNLTSWAKQFEYNSGPTTTIARTFGTPAVLDNGAFCFYETRPDQSTAFVALFGCGTASWRISTSSIPNGEPLTDGYQIFFPGRGPYLTAAHAQTGAITSTIGYGSQAIDGFMIFPSSNTTTTVIAATDATIMLTMQIPRLAPPLLVKTCAAQYCSMSSHTYFANVPTQCGNAALSCSQSYCSCLGGRWGDMYDSSNIVVQCGLSAAQVSAARFESCYSTAISCLTNAALDVYVSGIPETTADVCQRWAASISLDYALYYNATRQAINASQQSTNLWQACNYTACMDSSTLLSGAAPSLMFCTFAAVTRTPNYVPCVYTCPDLTCAASLAKCACTSRAIVLNLTIVANYELTAVLPTSRLQITAGACAPNLPPANYGSRDVRCPQWSCSDFSFTSSLQFTWSVASSALVQVLRSTGSTLSIPANFLAPGTYSVTVIATGLLSTQWLSTVFPVTVVAIDPSVRISGPTRVSSLNPFDLTVVVSNAASSSSYNWTCTSLTTDAQCPNLTNSTASALHVAAGAPVGRFTITYQYVANGKTATAATTIDIAADDIPIVKVQQALGGGIASSSSSFGVNAFAYTQQIAVSSTVDFSSGNYTRSWSVNGVIMASSGNATLSIAASTLLTTTVSDAKAGDYVLNVITLTATSQSNANIAGNASVTVVVLEPVGASLSVAKQGDTAATSAQSLTDSLAFTTSLTPSLTISTVPFAASLQTAVVYFTPVSGGALSLLTQLSGDGSALVGKAPLIPGNSTSAVVVTFGLQVSLNGIVVATANATFGITRGDLATIASS
ncbi:GPI-anchored surface protein, putative, partial [Bodo saltans]